jgi:hypothetical protein
MTTENPIAVAPANAGEEIAEDRQPVSCKIGLGWLLKRWDQRGAGHNQNGENDYNCCPTIGRHSALKTKTKAIDVAVD